MAKYYFCFGRTMMKSSLTQNTISVRMKITNELFCTGYDFAKYFVKCHNLFIYLFFDSHIRVIHQNDSFLYYNKNQISCHA